MLLQQEKGGGAICEVILRSRSSRKLGKGWYVLSKGEFPVGGSLKHVVLFWVTGKVLRQARGLPTALSRGRLAALRKRKIPLQLKFHRSDRPL